MPHQTSPRALLLEDRDYVRVTGADAVGFLNGLVSNDVAKVEPQRAVYAALLTPQGKYLFDFFVCAEGDGFLLDLDRPRADDLVRRLSMYKLRAKVAIEATGDAYRTIAFDGPVDLPAFPDPRAAALGHRRVVPAGAAPDIAARYLPWDIGAYRTAMIKAGIPDHGRDLIVDKTFLMDANFDLINGIDFKKGCYVGQELTARMKHRATARRRMIPVQAAGALPAPGTPILAGGREVGTLASGYGTLALAMIRDDKWAEAGDAEWLAEGTGLVPLKPKSAEGEEP